MCVRYTLHKSDAALTSISRALGTHLDSPEDITPRYNASLTDAMPVVASAGGSYSVRKMRWGIIPADQRSLERPRLLANARSETAERMPAFRDAIAGRRCLVPANGFYEWKSVGRSKQPYLFTLSGEEPFAFAGIWDPADAAHPETFCFLTTAPNSLLAPIHDRMPVLLAGDTARRWIGSAPLGGKDYGDLTSPLESGRMEARAVSRYVSNSRNEGPRCLEPPGSGSGEPEFDFG
jgi:putative SOS response-associated peptidase YedK